MRISTLSNFHCHRKYFGKIHIYTSICKRECSADENSAALLSERIPCLLEYLASSWLGFSSAQLDVDYTWRVLFVMMTLSCLPDRERTKAQIKDRFSLKLKNICWKISKLHANEVINRNKYLTYVNSYKKKYIVKIIINNIIEKEFKLIKFILLNNKSEIKTYF